jgi:UDP-N-acetyl-D-mannosaminuronic acid dehydrogenase
MKLVDDFVREVRTRTLHISVIGLGYVGIPTAAAFAESGFRVTGYDIDDETVSMIGHDQSLIEEPDLKMVVKRNFEAGRLKAQSYSEFEVVDSDCIMICVQTPINNEKIPDLSFVDAVFEKLSNASLRRKAVVLVSTVPSGTLSNYAKHVVEKTHLKPDEDMFLAYAPERISPGNSISEFIRNPRLIGGIGPNSTAAVASLYETVCEKVLKTDAISAEISKLAENTYRDVNIAFVNELSLICEGASADVTEVIRLANSHPRVALLRPGPGVGGPCLPKDPYFLLANNSIGREIDMITTARRTNDFMSVHVAKIIMSALKSAGVKKNQSNVALLGIAYKAGVGDMRGSPAVRVKDSLLPEGIRLRIYDPYVKDDLNGLTVDSIEECVRGADCLAVLTDHPDFSGINLERVKTLMNERPIIVDTRRVIDPQQALRAGFSYYGIGYGMKNSPRLGTDFS